MEVIAPAIITAIIIGIAEAIKKIGMKSKYIPIIDLILGLAAGMLFHYEELGIRFAIINGIIYGLTAAGLFSGIKTIIRK